MRLFIISLLLLGCISVPAQTLQQKEPPEEEYRTVFLGVGAGYTNVFTTHFGIQLFPEYSIACIAGIYLHPGGDLFDFFTNVGIKTTRHFNKEFPFLRLNAISVEVGYLPFRKGGSIELMAARENISSSFLTGFYSFGFVAISTPDTGFKLYPSFKVGLNFNF